MSEEIMSWVGHDVTVKVIGYSVSVYQNDELLYSVDWNDHVVRLEKEAKVIKDLRKLLK